MSAAIDQKVTEALFNLNYILSNNLDISRNGAANATKSYILQIGANTVTLILTFDVLNQSLKHTVNAGGNWEPKILTSCIDDVDDAMNTNRDELTKYFAAWV